MPDYGHDLQFGIFPSPAAAAAEQTLELALLAEVSGLDLVTLQDHPYQAKHLDTWTLLSVIAARTNAIRVSPNVANLPLRPPVVLARSAATLDLLSGGRVELGLGAGAFWDAIAAAGGPPRTPKESVDALVEAIGIIRDVWGTGTVRAVGEHYQVDGLHAGPQPAHDIPIWIGAYKPRMLRVTADLADAWIPSMGYADPPALAELNARIDDAAEANGRGPLAIRRMYNVFGRFGSGAGFLQGPVADWTEQLSGLAIVEGVGTFILGTDDPDDVLRFALEVVPAVREQVAAERELHASPPLLSPPIRRSGGERCAGGRGALVAPVGETRVGSDPRGTGPNVGSARQLLLIPRPRRPLVPRNHPIPYDPAQLESHCARRDHRRWCADRSGVDS